MLSLVALMIVQPMTISVVDGGRPDAARFAPRPWMVEGGSVVGQGPGNFLYADATLGDGDWTIRATLSLDKLDGTAASVVFDGADHLGCDGQDGRMFVEGPHFSADEPKFLDAKIVIQSGKPFDLVCTHIGDSLSISVGGSVVYKLDSAPLFRTVALRPHRATMRVTDFKVEGDVRKGLAAPGLQLIDVFVSGQGGYDTYRIPSLTMAPNGDVLAFCEGRKNGLSDSGNIDIVLRRSKDEGKTWLPMQTIWDDEKNTCGNPCVVVDKKTKTVFLLMTHNLGTDGEGQIINGTSKGTREVWITSSKDDGATWSKPKQITSEVKRGDWTWYATGPGAGIQIHRGPHVGHLVIPCDHIERDTKKYYSHVIYSDDDGETWQIGGSTPHDQTNECEVVELRDGWLMLNSRNYDRASKTRQISISPDGGEHWVSQYHDPELIEPICQASIRRATWPPEFVHGHIELQPLDRAKIFDETCSKTGTIYFSNPASTNARRGMTVKISYDDGRCWTKWAVVYEGSAAYSCLSQLKDGEMGLLFEADEYGRIIFTKLVFYGP